MPLYNPIFKHEEDEYAVRDDSHPGSLVQMVSCAVYDVMTLWFAESSMKVWVRIWLCFLTIGMMISLAFLPHPFAITNLVGAPVIAFLNGRELTRIRGVNKNMGWQHVVGWTPVMIVNILSLTTDEIGSDGKISWDNAGDDSYDKARYIAILCNTIILGISILFDVVDTVMYYVYDEKTIDRSRWTTEQLQKQ